MKRYSIVPVAMFSFLLGLSGGRAEGWFQFVNSATTLVLERTLFTPDPIPVPVGGAKVEFLYAELGTTDFSLFRPAAGYAPVGIAPIAGRFAGGTYRLLDIEPAATISAFVRGWTGSFATWEEARNSGLSKLGISQIFQIATTDPTLVPPAPPSNMVSSVPGAGFSGLILGVPEPTHLTLLALAGGAMLLQRKRRN